MVFTFHSPRKLDADEISPWNNLLGKAMASYNAMTDTQYKEPNLREALMKAQLANRYYGPGKESQMALQRAQTGEAGARTGFLGEQTKGAHIENQYMPEKMRAAIALNQAIASKRQAEMQALNSIFPNGFGGNNQNQGQAPNQSPGMQQGNPANQQQAIQQQLAQQQSTGQNPVQQNMNEPSASPMQGLTPIQSSAVSKLLGFDINPEQTARTKALGTADAKKIENLENTSLTASSRMDTINQLMDVIAKPEFQQMRQNPILGGLELKAFEKFGSPEQQKLVGDFKAQTGQIITDAAGQFKGAFRTGEQGLLNSMKPNENDSIGSMQGKVESLALMVEMIKQRSTLEAQLMRDKGLKPLQARDVADKLMNTKEMKSNIEIKMAPTKEEGGKTYKFIKGEWYESN
jgi:hypothetical protein